MPRPEVLHRSVCSLLCLAFLVTATWTLCPPAAHARGPEGFNTVVIDAGHGGFDRGGGPGQAIPEKPYTLDTSLRLQRALRARGFRTVLTRSDDTFVSLPERMAIANSYPDAIFVSVHYNSGARTAAHGYETYYYRSDSFGLASRLHQAQLASLDTEDRHVRRRGFFVVRRSAIPAVLCEGGFLTNPEESRVITNPSYRERWANNIADAIAMQSRYGDPASLGGQPAVSSERLVVSRGRSSVHHGGHYSRSRRTVTARRGRSSHGSSRRSSSRSSSHSSRSSHSSHGRRKHR